MVYSDPEMIPLIDTILATTMKLRKAHMKLTNVEPQIRVENKPLVDYIDDNGRAHLKQEETRILWLICDCSYCEAERNAR